MRNGLTAVKDEQQGPLAAEIGDEELKECVNDECLRSVRSRVEPTSYRSRTASMKKAASREKRAMRDEMAYRGTLLMRTDYRRRLT